MEDNSSGTPLDESRETNKLVGWVMKVTEFQSYRVSELKGSKNKSFYPLTSLPLHLFIPFLLLPKRLCLHTVTLYKIVIVDTNASLF